MTCWELTGRKWQRQELIRVKSSLGWLVSNCFDTYTDRKIEALKVVWWSQLCSMHGIQCMVFFPEDKASS